MERLHPFTSTSSDLLQAALECNADVQFQDRAVPDMDVGGAQPSEDREASAEATSKGHLETWLGQRKLRDRKLDSVCIGKPEEWMLYIAAIFSLPNLTDTDRSAK